MLENKEKSLKEENERLNIIDKELYSKKNETKEILYRLEKEVEFFVGEATKWQQCIVNIIKK